MEIVTIFESGSQAHAAVVKSLLDSEAIPYQVLGEGTQNLFGLGAFGTGFSPIVGSIKIQVPKEYEAKAKELLKEIDQEE